LRKGDWPYLVGIILSGGVVGPILLMVGLTRTSGGEASLLLNLEGAATALIAMLVFKENAGRLFWAALVCMAAGGVVLCGSPGSEGLHIAGPLMVAGAMAAWGVDNNFTRRLSERDPVAVARLKGGAAGIVNLAAAAVLGASVPSMGSMLGALGVGSMAYGLSLVLFIVALRGLGAARTGAFFDLAPFMGAAASVAFLGEAISWNMGASALLMALGAVLLIAERHGHVHVHAPLEHAHAHDHDDPHHAHPHEGAVFGTHSHAHEHPPLEHDHPHTPDLHHRHPHD